MTLILRHVTNCVHYDYSVIIIIILFFIIIIIIIILLLLFDPQYSIPEGIKY